MRPSRAWPGFASLTFALLSLVAMLGASIAAGGCSDGAAATEALAPEGDDAASPEREAPAPTNEAGATSGGPGSLPAQDAGSKDADADGPHPKVPAYRLPWTNGTSMQLTQDCDDSCCSDHVGSDEYAWDWANGGTFVVRAARAGTITHLKINSTTGCATTACSTDVNMIVVDHGDGSQAIYMHLAGHTAAPGVTCGATVAQGQALAMAGTTGHSTGVHLHFQVSQVHPTAPRCECGTTGTQCATTFNPFPDAWVNAPYHTLPVAFEEWPTASTCRNRRITMPAALSP